jgi:hypothetical protein
MVGNAPFPGSPPTIHDLLVRRNCPRIACGMKLLGGRGRWEPQKVGKGGSGPTHTWANPLPDWFDYLMDLAACQLLREVAGEFAH